MSAVEGDASAGRGAGRAKPFVAWINVHFLKGALPNGAYLYTNGLGPDSAPVVVTPLLPDDPRIGETWNEAGMVDVSIVSPVFVPRDGIARVVVGDGTQWRVQFVHALRRKSVLKTWCIPLSVTKRVTGFNRPIYIEAESKEAALKLLAESLEEVEP